jgi:hypothetical protein
MATDLSHIDFRAKAERMHRRAQAAESAALRQKDLLHCYAETCRRLSAQVRTKDRKLKRVRATLRQERMRDPLTRIIAIGKMFP